MSNTWIYLTSFFLPVPKQPRSTNSLTRCRPPQQATATTNTIAKLAVTRWKEGVAVAFGRWACWRIPSLPRRERWVSSSKPWTPWPSRCITVSPLKMAQAQNVAHFRQRNFNGVWFNFWVFFASRFFLLFLSIFYFFILGFWYMVVGLFWCVRVVGPFVFVCFDSSRLQIVGEKGAESIANPILICCFSGVV